MTLKKLILILNLALVCFLNAEGIFGLSTLDQARIAHKNKNFLEAEAFYEKSLKDEPNDIEAHYDYAKLLYSLKNYESALSRVQEAIQLAESKFYFFEDSRRKALLALYDLEGRIFYYQGDFANSTKSFELALQQNAYDLDHDSFVKISENLAFVYEQIAVAQSSLLVPVAASKVLPKLKSDHLLLEPESSDISFEDNAVFDEALSLDIEFPEFTEEGVVSDSEVSTFSSGNKIDPNLTSAQIKSKVEELNLKLEQLEETQAERVQAEQEELVRQSESPEAKEMEAEAGEWSPSRDEKQDVLEQNETPETTNKSGMDETYDDKNYFQLIPYEGREYATLFFDRFDTTKNTWRVDASEKFLLLRKAYEWDLSPKALPIQVHGFIYQDSNPKIALAVREGFAVDPDSFRFETSNAKSFQIKRGSIGTYILYIKGEGLKGTRFAYKLRKLAKPLDAEAAPTSYDVEPLIQSIPDSIRKELDIRLAKVTDTETRARVIEAYILRRAIYTDNNESSARDMTVFLEAKGKDAQNRFNQIARVLNQAEDLNFPKELRGFGFNCDIWSDFFIAIARYYKVPARKVTGFYNRFERDEFLNGSERHSWVSIFSDKKGHWMWLEPTPRGGLTSEQQDRLDEDEVRGAMAELEWLSAMKEKKEPEEKKEPPSEDNVGGIPNGSPDAPMPEDFDWIMYTDPTREAELSPEQRAQLKEALEKYTQKENEYRLKRKTSSATAAERLFEAMKSRNEVLPEEVKMISAFQSAANVFNVLSLKKDLNAKEEAFVTRYKKSRDQLLKYALLLLARPKHDPEADAAMFTGEILHALALVEPVLKFDPDDPQNRYKKLLDLAEKQLARTKPEALFEVVANNEDFYLINGGKSLYLGAKDGFSFEKIDFDPSPYTEVCQGAITPDGKHYALVVAIGETLYLIRDGLRSPLPFDSLKNLQFVDESGETLVVTGEISTQQGYYSVNVSLVNQEVFRHANFSTLSPLKKGRPHIGVWQDDVFDEKGRNVYTTSYLMIKGKKYLDPQTQKPISISTYGNYAGNYYAYSLDKDRFLVETKDSREKYHIIDNSGKDILPGNYSSIYFEVLYNPRKLKITANNSSTGKYEYYYYENNMLVPFTPEVIKNEETDEESFHFEEKALGKGRQFFYNGKPLLLENGKKVIVNEGQYALIMNYYPPYYMVNNFTLHKNSSAFDRYLQSRIYTFDPKRGMLIPVKCYNAEGNPVEFDLVDDLRVRGNKFVFFGRIGNYNYLVRNGRIDGTIPPQRANIGGYWDESIKGSIDIDKSTDYVLWSNGGAHFPFTTWLDNVPLVSHSSYRSANLYKNKVENVIYINISNSRNFWLLGGENLKSKISNLRKYLIDQDPEDFTKNSQSILTKTHLDQRDLIYLIRNTVYHSSSDSASSKENLQKAKEKIIENAPRVPALAMTRKERTEAILDIINWRADFDDASLGAEFDALAEAAKKNRIDEPIMENLKAEREAFSTWNFMPSALRKAKYLFYQKALAKSGHKDPSINHSW